jgi:energy-coupling factor transport system ATP-binding protein
MAEEEIVQRVTDGAPLDGTTTLAVDLRDVRFAYAGGARALDGVSLAVPQGQFVAIVGPNGGGKSTLARQLNGLLRPQQGTVALNGRPTAGRPVGELARAVGYVFQNPDHQIFAPSVREEVAFGPRNLGLAGSTLAQRVQEALAAFDLSAVSETPPAVLGYGLRRLVTLASVWAMQPPIWLLDEPTTGLDAYFTRLLMDRLHTLHQAGHTVLFITHDLKLAAQAQRVVVISQGRVVLDGPPSVVLAGSAALEAAGLRPPPIARLSALLAPHGFPHPLLGVEQFMETWKMLNGQRSIVNVQSPDGPLDSLTIDN